MHPGWKRLAIVLVCLGILAFFLARGGEPEAPVEDAGTGFEPILIPLPAPPEPEPVTERARGMYMLRAEDASVSLELMRDRTFRFLSTRKGAVREGTGTWSLAGRRLSLAYTHIDGKAIEGDPVVVVNAWYGDSIELKDTGLEGRVILTKRAMIKQR